MLALAHAAAYPEDPRGLVLLGCGTFDVASREHMRRMLDARTDAALTERLERLAEEIPDPDARRRAQHEATLPLYAHDLVTRETELEELDVRAHRETWDDALRLQREGFHPAAFASIRVPVLMIHGAEDPHPGREIFASIAPHVPSLEYLELPACGHYPWLERSARAAFFSSLRGWLDRLSAAEGISPLPERDRNRGGS